MSLIKTTCDRSIREVIFSGDKFFLSENFLANDLEQQVISGEYSLHFLENRIASLDILILDKIIERRGTVSDEMAVFLIEIEVEYCWHNFTGEAMFRWLNSKNRLLADWFVKKAIFWLKDNTCKLYHQLQEDIREHIEVLQHYDDAIVSLTRLSEYLQHFKAIWKHILSEELQQYNFHEQFFTTVSQQLRYPTWRQDPKELALNSLSKLAEMCRAKLTVLKIQFLLQMLNKLDSETLAILNSYNF